MAPLAGLAKSLSLSSCASTCSLSTSSTTDSSPQGLRSSIVTFLKTSVKQLEDTLAAEKLRNSQREQELQQLLAVEQAARLEAEQRLAATQARGTDQKMSDIARLQWQLREEVSKRLSIQRQLHEKEKQLVKALQEKEAFAVAKSRISQKDQELQQQQSMKQAAQFVSDLARMQQQCSEEMTKRQAVRKTLQETEKQLEEARRQLLQKDAEREEFQLQALERERQLQEVFQEHQAMQGEVIKKKREVHTLKEQLRVAGKDNNGRGQLESTGQSIEDPGKRQRSVKTENSADHTHTQLQESPGPDGESRGARSLAGEFRKRQAKEMDYLVRHM
mmetsp:Transcript_71824/g.198269  ORF Transcript_71824/g.198269 Transcript_71824/m.198269 type:complete len:332 (-) Transcript_71824:508-1503(-)